MDKGGKYFFVLEPEDEKKRQRLPALINGILHLSYRWQLTSTGILRSWPGFAANRKCGTKRDLF